MHIFVFDHGIYLYSFSIIFCTFHYNGVQSDYSNLFPKKQFYASHHMESMDLVLIHTLAIEACRLVVSLDAVWSARVQLLFLTAVLTDISSISFDCALVLTLETYNGNNCDYLTYLHYYLHYYNYCMSLFKLVNIGWPADCLWIRLPEAFSFCNFDPKSPWKIASSTSF